MPTIADIDQLILCGPIVRRVEPKQAAIWLALKSAAAVELVIWEGLIKHDDIDDTPVVGKSERRTTSIGKHLHLVTVNLELEAGKLLEWGKIYSYNLSITPDGGSKQDLKDLKLLDALAEKEEGKTVTALSYEVGQLPSFALPSDRIESLRLLHGSCRNNDAPYEDALSWVNDFIKADLEDINKRPQQLFLSGDQIYADSVVGELLHELTQWGNSLLDDQETLPTEWRENADTAPIKRWKADTMHFPAYFRANLILSEARFTTTDKNNHLIAFGEFAAMYMSVWSNVLWTVDLQEGAEQNAPQHFENIFDQITDRPENYGAIFRRNLTDERNNIVVEEAVEAGEQPVKAREVFSDDIVKKSIDFLLAARKADKAGFREAMLQKKDNKLNELLADFFKQEVVTRRDKIRFRKYFEFFKGWMKELHSGEQEKANKERGDKLRTLHRTLTKVRRALANISTFMIFDDHEVTDDWNLNPTWRDQVYSSYLGRAIVRNALTSYALFQDWGNRAKSYNRENSGLFEIEENVGELVRELDGEQFSDTLKAAFEKAGLTLEGSNTTVQIIRKEDWKLLDGAKEDEYIVRKYQIKEGTGEAAKEKEVIRIIQNPHALLLKLVSQLYQENNTKREEQEEQLDFLLGLDHHHRVVKSEKSERYQLRDNRSPIVKWHYSYEGMTHKVLVIDNRTRRSYVSFAGAPGNISVNGMQDLIPEDPQPKENEVLFVVAPLPVLGPSMLDELIAPTAYRVYDLIAAFDGDETIKTGMKGTNPDAIEAWVFDPVGQEELFKRLAPFQRIIFLSGDVHYGSTQRMHYWKKGADQPACFAQLTSSGLRNIMPGFIQYISQHFGIGQKLIRGEIRAERLGWHDNDPKPLKFPDEKKVNAFLKYKLKNKPVLITPLGWPEGTTYGEDNEPDWSWRVHNVIDERREEERPGITQLVKIEETVESRTVDAFRKTAARHSRQIKQVNFTRQILFKANIGLVTFEKEEKKDGVEKEPPIHLIHNLYAVPFQADAKAAQQQELFAVHRIVLAASEADQPPSLNPKK
ncbi:metallophosphoesterase family protein [Flavilitoribacter nigricans]|uniref:PhoD-like phosphatase metallophosphatase domain-containing protein n=1 Tax=Flavilitoribacter nigricans (strain ATCC 23147 / DSM 23189 / NBRC 102662 / NCIMB 1420 / SS-2) TaxID=1122177 RepID=A0A2D0N0K6_FLAN2|nr:hypothetical protein [Flavilitoribacter nigricans]PHN01997.1 hypothetical protein CRP01_34390 [Flavilitoribacter nigricans DSM 23189 = NBRC 102662]